MHFIHAVGKGAVFVGAELIPFQRCPLKVSPLKYIPFKRLPLRAIPLKWIPFSSSPLKRMPFSTSCDVAVGCEAALFAEVRPRAKMAAAKSVVRFILRSYSWLSVLMKQY